MTRSRHLTMRAKLLLIVGAGFVLASVVVAFVADRWMTARTNQEQEELFTERLNSIVSLLDRKQDILARTGMEEAYRANVQEAAAQELAKRYYTSSTLDSYPLILDAQGRVVMHPTLVPGTQMRALQGILAADQGELVYEFQGESRWCMFRTFWPWDWSIAYTIPLHHKYAQVSAFRKTFLAAMGATGLLVLVALFTMISLATRPIGDLTLAASRIADGDLDQDVNTRTGGEIGTLARNFARMRDAIRTKIRSLDSEVAERRQAQGQLADLNRTLEQRVEQRTLELTAANKAAEDANQAKSEFLANMSHEIRTPLTAILGFADLLKERSLTESDRLTWLGTIQRNGEHLLGLLNDILDLSKVEARKIVLKTEPCRLVKVVADVMSMMRLRSQQRGLEFSVQYAGPVPETILADENRLRQVLVNLVGNAVKFTEAGSVTVGVSFLPQWREGQPAVQLAVTDTGIGIAPQDLQRLCEPFCQVDGSSTRKVGGTGLGLAISRRLVELMGGELTIRSEVGKGSVFAITIPTGPLDGVPMLQKPSEAILAGTPDRAHKAPREYRLEGTTILVAEDGPDNQRLIRVLLTKAGATVELAENGRVAVERAIATRPDLILMDMQMPEMDGYQATRTLREKGLQVPIIALTAHALPEDRQQCLSAGCTGYLAKPIDRWELLAAVSDLVHKGAPKCESPAHVPTSDPQAESDAIVSEYANDPDLAEVIDEFVAGLGHQIMSMREALANGHFDEFRRLSHQLKGAGGSYGYGCLTDVAATLERLAKAADVEGSTVAVAELERLCRAVVRGRPQASRKGS